MNSARKWFVLALGVFVLWALALVILAVTTGQPPRRPNGEPVQKAPLGNLSAKGLGLSV